MSDEHEPREAADPEECFGALEVDADTEDDWTPGHGDEFEPGPIQKVFGRDGLPGQSAPAQLSDIPVLSTETLVCMGDESKFVFRDNFGDIICEFMPDEVNRTPEGTWRVPWPLFEQRMALKLAEWRQLLKDSGHTEMAEMDFFTLLHAIIAQWRRGPYLISKRWMEVEPLRKPCAFYCRQHLQYDMAPENTKVVRLCMARQDTAGAFMSVSDRAVWACELRKPPVLEQLERLDSFDRQKVAEGEHREYLPILDPGNEALGGIFGGKNDRRA